MANRTSLTKKYRTESTAKNSRSGLPTIFSDDDASSAQSESSSVAISDASSIKSSEYAASLISDCLSATSSDSLDDFASHLDDSTMVSDLPRSTFGRSSRLDVFSHSDGDTTTLDDSVMVGNIPCQAHASKCTSLSMDRTESSDSPWVDESDASSFGCDTFDTDIEAARSTTHPRSKESKCTSRKISSTESSDSPWVNESVASSAGSKCKPIDLTDSDLEVGNDFARVTATGGAKLHGVHYVSSLKEASTHRGLSVVEPIGKREASDAFHRVIPSTIPIDSERDDLSSIGALSLQLPRFSMISNNYWRRAGEDVRPERQSQTPSVQAQEEYTKGLCFLGGRTDIEVFFIAIISVSLFILVVLLAIILIK
jgi:hypothetical protein